MTKAYSYIRFSDPKQREGHSEKRQQDAAEKYCKEHGLILDTTLNMKALGESAYRGKHRQEGAALGVFLKLVQDEKIEPGSVLIVENFDRLSREKVMDAFDQFRSIIKAGIKLVTLSDGQEYTWESVNRTNPFQLIISIVWMIKAHDESDLKAKRIKDTWDDKRQKGKILTGKAHKWLKPLRVEDARKYGKRFEVIPAAAFAIKQIFEWKLDEYSGERIVDELKKQAEKGGWSPPAWKRNEKGGWRKSYVQHILQNRAVLGEFQPHKMAEDDSREKIGLPIPDYYPRIIDDDTFYRVERMIEENKQRPGYGGGRTGKVKSLFTSIVKCELCGGPMYHTNKGKPPKGGEYLHCPNKDCHAEAVRYKEFEKIVLQYLQELDFSQLIQQPGQRNKKLAQIKVKIEAMGQQVLDLQRSQKNVRLAIHKTEGVQQDRFIAEEKQLYEKEQSIAKLIKDLERERDELKADSDRHRVEEIISVSEALEKEEDQDKRILLRAKLRRHLQQTITSIFVRALKSNVIGLGRRNRLAKHEFQKHQFESSSIAHINIRFTHKKLTKSLANKLLV